MSREIDRLPEVPQEKRKKMKVVIASASRSGTLGLYTAMQMLGFKPYHMVEVVLQGGIPHMRIVGEAITAEFNPSSGIKRYERPELDKWLANYDCLVEVGSYLGTSALEAYAQDPDVKFILTERDPDKWVRSMNNTAGVLAQNAVSFPINILRKFQADIEEFFGLNVLVYHAVSGGTWPGDPKNHAIMRAFYVEYIQNVKKIIPKEKLHVIKLEDGLGWENICPFLGFPIPDQEYPRGNEPEKFHRLVGGYLQPKIRTAMFRLGVLAVSTLGVVGYGTWNYIIPTLNQWRMS